MLKEQAKLARCTQPIKGQEADDEDAQAARPGRPAATERTEGRLVGREDRAGAGDSREQREGEGRETNRVPDTAGAPSVGAAETLQRTPLFHAQHAERYARQTLIRQYEEAHNCRLAVLIDVIFPEVVTLFEELIFDADSAEDLHLLLDTPGGDGETAIRLVRSAQARCRELTIIVPNQAKSAGTILLMGAHHIREGG